MLFRTQMLLVPLLVVLLFGIGCRAEETATVEPPEPLDFSYTRLWKYAQQQCDLKGITQTEFTNSWLTVRRCLKDTLDVVQLNEDSMRMDASNQEVILTRHCPKLYEGVKCFDPFVELVRTCVDEESFEIFSSLRAWFRDILDFLCESNGTNFVYDKKKHDACTRDLNVHLITCAAENMNFIITPQLNRRNLSEEFCNMLTKAKDCLLGKLKPCDVFANGARLFYKNFIQITSCKATTDQH
ncbi:uncharacterized protein LOC125955665 [Anopheles darlingi]|uniref:uncharacterized protein LOC125955665 n=1 Tax=Anopheles darlingi TaxID=43151 RepID=UPI0021005CA7|nr:uncharacterized protein LOC125955665 [Anopheles darlingi]